MLHRNAYAANTLMLRFEWLYRTCVSCCCFIYIRSSDENQATFNYDNKDNLDRHLSIFINGTTVLGVQMRSVVKFTRDTRCAVFDKHRVECTVTSMCLCDTFIDI